MSTQTITPQVPMIGTVFGEDSPRARRSDPETSQEAADTSVSPAESQAHVLRVLAVTGPLADHEVFDWLEADGVMISPSRVRTARHELVEQGLVEFSGFYHLTPSGRRTRVWAVTEQGHVSRKAAA